MTYIKGTLLFISGVIISLTLIIFLLINRGGFSTSTVTIEVHNKSDYKITKILIKHEDGEVHHKNISAGSKVFLPMYSSGESSYTITAHLENGSINSGGIGYVESGYKTKETITNSGINSEYGSMY